MKLKKYPRNIFNSAKLTQEDIENLNGPIKKQSTMTLKKKKKKFFPQRKLQSFTSKLSQILKES